MISTDFGKGFFTKKNMAQVHKILKIFFFLKLSEFYDKFHKIAKNIEKVNYS